MKSRRQDLQTIKEW